MFWAMFIPGSSHDFKNSCIKHEFKIHSSARKGPMPGSHLPHLAMQSRPAMSQDLSMTNAPGLITAICPISIDTTTLEPMSAESQAHHRWNLSPSVESQVPLGAHRFPCSSAGCGRAASSNSLKVSSRSSERASWVQVQHDVHDMLLQSIDVRKPSLRDQKATLWWSFCRGGLL